jgi:succinoglycan biosynthesis transport protein ExoP
MPVNVQPFPGEGAAGNRSLGQYEERIAEPILHSSLRVLRRRAKLAVAVFLFFTIPTGVFIERRPPVYAATSRILVERNDQVSSVRKEQSGDDQSINGDLQMQAQLLRSRPIVAKAIQQIRLWESSEFQVGPPIGGGLEEISSKGLVDQFLKHLTIVPLPGTHLLTIVFEASEPAVAMKAVNALTETFIREQLNTHFAESSKTIDWLRQRIDEQRAHVNTSDKALQNYMEAHDAVSVQDRQNIVVQKLADLNTALTRAKTDRMSKQALYNQLESLRQDPGAVDTLPVVLSNPLLQQLRGQLAELKQKQLTMSQELGDRHPEMIKIQAEIDQATERLGAELTKLTDSVQNDFIAARSIEQGLMRALDEQKREVINLNQKTLDYGALQRQAASDRDIYARLLSEAQTRGVIGNAPEIKIQVIEPAELPLGPLGPQNTRDLMLTIAAGLFLAVSVPLTLESFDQRIRTPADIEDRLQVPYVAMVPRMSRTGNQLQVSVRRSIYNEAFRRIRTFVTSEPGATRLLIVSALPQEGKSLVAANLAITLAGTGRRVILVDGDLRRPNLHKIFGLNPVPGLVELLKGSQNIFEAIRATKIANLSVLPCRTEARAAAELLSAPTFKTLLRVLDASFDWIIFDSPPVGPVSDACIIGRLMERALIVVNADSTPAGAAIAMIHELKSANVKPVGGVLNRADLSQSPSYCHPYYHTSYSTYHESETA